jgi:hypothetical protein
MLALHLVLPLAALVLVVWQPSWSTRNVFRVVLFSEAGMLVVWAGLSAQPWPRKAAACLVGLAVGFALLRIVDARYPALKLVECLVFPGIATLAFTVAIRASLPLDDDPEAAIWQFTVGQLLIITTAIALAIALLQWFWKGSLVVDPRLMASEGAQISVVLMTWAVLPRRWRGVRTIAALVMVCGVGIIVQSFMSESWFWEVAKNFRTASFVEIWGDLFSIPVVTLIESLLASATLLMFYGNRRLPNPR